MATENQINANRTNALSSTGPRTDQGRAAVSQNATKTGLFSRAAYIRPEDLPRYNAIHDAFYADLGPNGPLEENLVTEIIRASWRLERCAAVEAALYPESPVLDPMANDDIDYCQHNVDRARAQSHRIIMRTLAELRRLQTERRAQYQAKREQATAQKEAKRELTKQSQSAPQSNAGSARNAPCPCNSGRKYKHCCAQPTSFVQAA